MAKKKRNNKSPTTPKPAPETFDNKPFAALAGLARQKKAQARDVQAEREAERRQRQHLVAEAQAERRPIIGADQLRRGADVHMSDADLFVAALGDLDASKINAGKYGGQGPITRHVQPQPDPNAPPPDPYSSAEALFAAEFFSDEVTRIKDNIHVPTPIDVDRLYKLTASPPPEDTRERAVETVTGDDVPTLTRDQLRLIEEARAAAERAPLPSVNLRGMIREVGLEAIKNSVALARDRGDRYLRVITGKGLQSAAEPVLKIALVEWCTAHNLRYAPELLPDGSFGAVILHVPRR